MEITKILGIALSRLRDWQLFIIILSWIFYLFYNSYRLDKPIRIIETELNNSYKEMKKELRELDKELIDLIFKIEDLVKSIKYDIIMEKLESIESLIIGKF